MAQKEQKSVEFQLNVFIGLSLLMAEQRAKSKEHRAFVACRRALAIDKLLLKLAMAN